MTKRSKRLERLRRNPKNVSYEELQQVLEDFGFVLKRSKGSHYIFDVQVGDKIESLIVPFTKPHIKPVYVKRGLEIIDAIIEQQENSDAGEVEDDQ